VTIIYRVLATTSTVSQVSRDDAAATESDE